jgi:phage terminase large subunit GpA-like protein
VKRERQRKDRQAAALCSRFYNFNASIMKMGLYRDLAKDDPLADGYVAFPEGPRRRIFPAAHRRAAHAGEAHGFTVYRWTKDASQANEALDT